jgi:hypothetical protein
MTFITLLRRAPVAPDAAACQLCDCKLAGTFQDHLLVGQPGTAETRAVICTQCGDVLSRLIHVFGGDLRIVTKDSQGRPISSGGQDAELNQTRQRLQHEADTLGRTVDTLRAEAEKLKVVRPRDTK